jgi:hypothetical protein
MRSDQHFLPQLHLALGLASPALSRMSSVVDKRVVPVVETMSKRNAEASPGTEAGRSHVRLVDGDPPMLRLEINLHSWERGDSDIDIVLPHGGELSDLLHWALPEQRLVICGNLRARILEELAEVFTMLEEPAD